MINVHIVSSEQVITILTNFETLNNLISLLIDHLSHILVEEWLCHLQSLFDGLLGIMVVKELINDVKSSKLS